MILRTLFQYLPLLIGLGLFVLAPADCAAQVADVPGTIRDSSSVQSMMPPFGKVIAPQGTYTHGTSTYAEIRVELQTVSGDNWIIVSGSTPRIASTGQSANGTLVWSAASYQGLAAGSYRVRASLWEGFGNPPTPPAILSQSYSATLIIP